MKSLIFLLGFGVSFLFAQPNYKVDTVALLPVETTANCNYGQCGATAKSTKKRCKHCVSSSGDLYCWQHD